MIRTRTVLVPFVLAATGTLLLVFSGCRKEPEVPPNSPEVYMKDPAFVKQLDEKRRELRAIVSERAPLVRRMEELVRSNRQDLAVLQKIPEWTNLHARVVALNAKYAEVRQRQLKIFRDRAKPAETERAPRPTANGKISK